MDSFVMVGYGLVWVLYGMIQSQLTPLPSPSLFCVSRMTSRCWSPPTPPQVNPYPLPSPTRPLSSSFSSSPRIQPLPPPSPVVNRVDSTLCSTKGCTLLHPPPPTFCPLLHLHPPPGKTVVAEYAIALSLKQKQRVIYTTPIKVCSQLGL